MSIIERVQSFSENLWEQETAPHGADLYDKEIAELDGKRNSVIAKIGEIYVKNNTVETSLGTPFEEPMKTLKETAEKKELLFRKKLALQGQRKCENCGNVLPLDSLFCNKCGEKLEPLSAEEIQAVSAVRLCPKCGVEVEPDAVFCVSCGNKL